MTGFVNFGGSAFTQRNSNHDPFGFNEQSHHQNDFDDVIEGEFEDRSDAKSFHQAEKKGPHNDS